MINVEFSFSQADLFQELYQFRGNQRRSLMGMFKKCHSIDMAKSIGNFLWKHNLGGWCYKLDSNVIYVYLHKTTLDALWLMNKKKALEANFYSYKQTKKVLALI